MALACSQLFLWVALLALPLAADPAGKLCITGTVVDPALDPIAGAQAVLISADTILRTECDARRNSTPMDGGKQLRVHTDRTGQFVIENVPAGYYRLRITKNGYPPVERDRVIQSQAHDLFISAQISKLGSVVICD